MTRILVVEDQSLTAENVQRTLLGLGYEVSAIVANGACAIDDVQRLSPDLVLIDIRLPGEMSGIETAYRIRQVCDVPVVFLTALADMNMVAEARRTDPFGYVLKSFSSDQLQAAIEAGLARQRLERKIRERELWFATTLKSVGDAVIATDPEGQVTFMNPVAEQLTGWKEPEALGKQISEVMRLVSAADGTVTEDVVARVRREGRAVLLSRTTLLRARDGSELFIDDSAAPIVDTDDRLLGVVVVFRDISERKKIEAQLALSARLAALGVITAGIAHEINNPLAYILANCSVALRDTAGLRRDLAASVELGSANLGPLLRRIDDVVHAIEDAKEGSERVQRIVGDLKMLSGRPAHTDHRALALVPMLESATRMAWSEIKHRARFVTDFQAAPHVHGDQSQLAQVIVNLLINAAQAIPEGQRDKNEIRLTLKTDARGDAMIEVHDTGLGMAPEVMLRIFDPFFTTKPVGVGTGLGLSISDNLIESHGGKLTVQSSLGKGTTFRVSLPKAEAPTPIPPTIYSAPPPAALAQRARVLAVDDEPKVGAVISRALAPDHDVTVVTGGSEALALFRKGMRFDIVFCDLMMPCMSGPELHEQLQKEFPQQAECMVFLTGGVFTPRMATFLESIPSNRRVSKPFPLDLLHELVQKRLGSKR